jgi:hypothetical protein
MIVTDSCRAADILPACQKGVTNLRKAKGNNMDYQRRFIRIGDRVINLDSVAFVEYGKPEGGPAKEALTIWLNNGNDIELYGDEAMSFWTFMQNSAPEVTKQDS